jgi:2-polyprenyl-3-methyl-5-hydroxy-6-metoxy-1,4-benzoquinol methylase
MKTRMPHRDELREAVLRAVGDKGAAERRKIREEAEAATYFGAPRVEMLDFVPTTALSVLDVGCAEGAFSRAVKNRTGAEVWGIEYDPHAAEHAKAVIDRVLVGDANEQIAKLPDGYFDVIICNDVLEHLVDPYATLVQLRGKLKPGGVVVASIPNIRFLPALSQLVFRRDFPQEDSGIFDRTHLRFFTRRSIVRMFETSGFTVRSINGINAYYPPYGVLLAVLSFGYFADAFYLQYACVATPAD